MTISERRVILQREVIAFGPIRVEGRCIYGITGQIAIFESERAAELFANLFNMYVPLVNSWWLDRQSSYDRRIMAQVQKADED
jgi:hypothetical protein